MKKIILSALALAVFGIAGAQEKAKQKSSSDATYGLKAGANYSTVTGDVEDIDPVLGIHVGIFAEFKIASKFFIRPELLYSLQGGKSSGIVVSDGTPFNVKENLHLNYLNVPVLVKYYAQPKLSFLAGPQIGFLMSAKDKLKFAGETGTGSNTVDVKDNVNTVDFGLMLGVGYDFSKEFFAEARYNIGLSDAFKDTDGTAHNGVAQISLGYRFK